MIAVRASHDGLNANVAQKVVCLIRSVVRSAVYKQNRILAVVRPLKLNFGEEFLQKEAEHITVRMAHGQSHIN